MRIVVTGSREATEEHRDRISLILSSWLPKVVGVGDAAGVDTYVREFCIENGIMVTTFKADWDRYKRAAGPKRNRLMLDVIKPDLVVAFLMPKLECRGTWDCIEAALERSIQVAPYRLER